MRVPPFSFCNAPYDVVLTTEPSDDVTVAAPPATGSDADSTAILARLYAGQPERGAEVLQHRKDYSNSS